MIYLFIIGSIAFGSLCPMERQPSALSVVTNSPINDTFGEFDGLFSSAGSPDEDELCDFAINRYASGAPGIDRYLKPFLKKLLKDSPPHSHLRRGSNADVLRATKNNAASPKESVPDLAPSALSVLSISDNDQRMYDMIVKAMHGAIEEREKALEEKERILILKEERIRQKYSGKKTAIIASAAATISTIVTTICATMVTLNSK